MCRFAGQVGYIIAGMKDVKEAQIGDTLHLQERPVEALPGFKPAKPMVFAGEEPLWISHTFIYLQIQTGILSTSVVECTLCSSSQGCIPWTSLNTKVYAVLLTG